VQGRPGLLGTFTFAKSTSFANGKEARFCHFMSSVVPIMVENGKSCVLCKPQVGDVSSPTWLERNWMI
jgi:hypothetical protein